MEAHTPRIRERERERAMIINDIMSLNICVDKIP